LEKRVGSALVELTFVLVLCTAAWMAHRHVLKEGRQQWRELESLRRPYDGLVNGR
jgi:hypothetical protein